MTSPEVLYRRAMTRLRLRNLLAIVRVAELGSVKRAAETMGLTQPGTTLLVSETERLLESQLFYRHGRGMRLTTGGMELLPFLQRALLLLEEGVDRLVQTPGSAHQTLRVAAIEGAILGLLTRSLAAFGQAHPDISLELEEGNAARIRELIAGWETDLILFREPEVMPVGWDYLPLMEDRLVVVAGAGHPLARRKRLSMADLKGESWILLPAATEARKRFEQLMETSGQEYTVHKQLKTRSFAVLEALMNAQRTVLLAPYSVMRERIESQKLSLLNLDEQLPLKTIGVLYRSPGATTAARAFVDHCAAFTKKFP